MRELVTVSFNICIKLKLLNGQFLTIPCYYTTVLTVTGIAKVYESGNIALYQVHNMKQSK